MRDHGPIVVPLDGSELAEGAVAYAVALAAALQERIILVTAWEGAERDFGASFPALASDVRKTANDYYGTYLAGVQSRIAARVPAVETRIVEGSATAQILEVVSESSARLLVIATHGRSGVGRWLYGSTASRLLREAEVPVVAVGPHALERGGSDVTYRHVMVPLDGSDVSEAALPIAKDLAARLSARVSLVRAVPPVVQLYPYALPSSYVPQMDEELEAGAKQYLQRCEQALKPVDVDAFVVRGPVAEGLIEFVEKQSIDLVVMTTHARAGVVRAVLGSTADRLLQGNAPVMLLRPDAIEEVRT